MIDQFWNVKEREAAEEQQLRDRLDAAQRAIALGKRALALKSAAGYQDFFKAIEDMRSHSMRMMVHEPSDTELRRLQGRVQAFTDILGVLDRSENAVEQLAAQVESIQTELAAARKRRPNKEVRA